MQQRLAQIIAVCLSLFLRNKRLSRTGLSAQMRRRRPLWRRSCGTSKSLRSVSEWANRVHSHRLQGARRLQSEADGSHGNLVQSLTAQLAVRHSQDRPHHMRLILSADNALELLSAARQLRGGHCREPAATGRCSEGLFELLSCTQERITSAQTQLETRQSAQELEQRDLQAAALNEQLTATKRNVGTEMKMECANKLLLVA